jgi:hypothetical protein
MGRSLLFSAFLGGVLLIAATSRSDVAAPDATSPPALPAGVAAPEPISGTAAVSAPGDETPAHDPFTLYDIGPPGTKAWTYADLSPSEKAEADRGADTTGWDKVNNAYAAAAAERARQAASDAAGHQLGVDNLAVTGVVP